jgi:hypothetical protein
MAKRIKAKTDNSGWVEPKKKVRKKRKPMSVEQKAAAAERLEKARQARAEKNPDYGQSGIHESLRNLSDDYPISPKKVKVWIKTQKELASAERRAHKAGIKGAYARMCDHEGYVKHMNTYLRNGDWCDLFYGEHQEKKIGRVCRAQAYYFEGPKKGDPKFDVGVYYPLLGAVYTQEMYNEDNGVEDNGNQSPRKPARKRNKRTVEKEVKKRNRNT